MKQVRRLAAQFKPEHYILELNIDRKQMAFAGSVIISGHKTGKPSKRLTFHQRDLKITRCHITHHDKKGDQNISTDRINTHNSFEEVRLHAPHDLYPGRYTVTLEFNGQITDAMNGIYPCNFKHEGADKKLIATQFESHHAREVFPCIDEPEAKATFDLSLITDSKDPVVANTPIKKQEARDDGQLTTFETTPKMSTYLLAFVYGDMKYKEAKAPGGTTVRVYATPDNIDFTNFALDFSVKCLEFYNEYFGIAYPLDKCDLVALPDFASGAMENWGCITFREQALLVDPKNSALINKQYVAMVIAHELAHQWFGNLVTMRWWTDLWLNEGFASWIEYLAVDHIYPDWKMWTQFVVDEQQRALQLDALQHTHPIEVAVHHPDEIRSIFDTISYSKGSSVINMLYEYLGPSMFQEGLSFYLSRHQYKNTDTTDLWAAFEEVSAKPVKEFMHAWTAYSGFPLLNVAADENGLELSQERFHLNPQAKLKPDTHWPIPLLATNALLPDIFNAKEGHFALKEFDDLKVNRHHSGFYRVAYNATHLIRLGELVAKGHLQPLDRLGLLSDAFESAKAGRSATAEALKLLDYFKEESNAAVWEVIAGALASTRATMDDEALREAMKPFVRRLTAKQLARLGWEETRDESHFDKLLRPTILGMNAAADEPSVVKQCQELFTRMRRSEDIAPNLRSVVYNTVARLGGKAEYEKLLKLHNNSNSSEERTTLAAALCNFEQPEFIKRSLESIKTDDVRRQDVAYWLSFSFSNRFAKDLTWQWLKNNWHWLQQNLGSDLSFYRFPMYAARAFSKPEFLDEFKKFFAHRRSPALNRAIDQGIETIEWQTAWRQRDLRLVEAFFEHKSK